ncbi:helix-turn-helix domain-containing protein [Paenibacillus larvae]
MNIIQKIDMLMEQKGMTKYKLAKESGLPQSTITSIMSGRIKNPSLDSLMKIANALEVPISYLFEDSEVADYLRPQIKEAINETIRDIANTIQRLSPEQQKLVRMFVETLLQVPSEPLKKKDE